MNLLPRRSILLGSALVPALMSPLSNAIAAQAPKTWDITCDVLVLGAGIAGLSAAVSAKEEGAKKVVVLEKNPNGFLNSSTYSMGMFRASGTQVQKRNGVEDPGPEDFAKEVIDGGHGYNDTHLVKIFAENSGETVDWLEKKGVQFTLAPSPVGVRRAHLNGTPSGARYLEVLNEEAKKLGVEILFSTKADALVTNKEENEVLGVKATSKEGKPISIRATKAVIIATGGFMGSPAMIDKNLIEFNGALSCASPASTGDGILMAQKIGADTYLLNKGAVYGYGVPVDLEKRRGMIFRGHIMALYGTIAVGEDAKRFIADEADSTEAGKEAARRGFGHIYAIATQEQLDDFMEHDKAQVIGWSQDKFKEELNNPHGFIRKADTIPELAKKLGINAEELEKTIERYNGFVKAGKDGDFGRKSLKGTFEKGPYYGFICQPVAMANLGGLKAGDTMEIVDVYGKPIKHLYAVGEAVGGVHGDSYIGGDSVGSSLTIGRYVGKLAARN